MNKWDEFKLYVIVFGGGVGVGITITLGLWGAAFICTLIVAVAAYVRFTDPAL